MKMTSGMNYDLINSEKPQLDSPLQQRLLEVNVLKLMLCGSIQFGLFFHEFRSSSETFTLKRPKNV